MSANGDGDHYALSEQDRGRFIIAVDVLREQMERGEGGEVPQPIADFIGGVAILGAAPFPEEFRRPVVEAIARASSTVLLTVVAAMHAPVE